MTSKTNLPLASAALVLALQGLPAWAQQTQTQEQTGEQPPAQTQEQTGEQAPAQTQEQSGEQAPAQTQEQSGEQAPAQEQSGEQAQDQTGEQAPEAATGENQEPAETTPGATGSTTEPEEHGPTEGADGDHAEDDHGGDHGAGHVHDVDFSFEGPFGAFDQNQLQRGLQIYTEVCAACHGLQYVPIRTLSDEGGPHMPEDQIRAYAGNFEVYDDELEDFRPATPNDHFPQSSLENAPDLSLMAKARAGFHGPYGTGLNQLFQGMGGPEYIVSLLTGYTGETREQAGTTFYENTAFPGGWIAMAPPLAGGDIEFADGHANDLHHEAEDVAAFLMWAAEPKLMARKHAGLTAVIFLVILSSLLYLTNKRIWAPHKPRKADA